MNRRVAVLALTLVLTPWEGTRAQRSASGSDPDRGKLVVYRDEFGIPHIYGPSAEAGLYAMGYSQAEDRMEELLKNLLRAMGEMAAAFGPTEFANDLQSRLWRHYDVARTNYEQIRPNVRGHLAAFVRGINDYMSTHPEEVPSWWGKRPVEPAMAVALSRWFIWGWPAGQALAELRNSRIAPNFTSDFRSSNEMAIAPARTTVRAPILIIDPHLSWWGPQRFWEVRIRAGELHGSGFTIPGVPYVGLGHNDNVAWAMTTGGPDTADIYVLKLNPDNPLEYKYDNEWKKIVPRSVRISVRGEEKPRELTFYDSHYGPIVARQQGEAFAAKLSYAQEIRICEAFYMFNIARNVGDIKAGLDLNQIMPQNVMAADTSGNIYYQRAGRVPIRPLDADFSRPVDGSTSKNEWLGIHPARDLISIENPPQGYMQNCNTSPDVMMVDSPMTPDKKPAYMFNQTAGAIHQRGARAVELLTSNSKVTPESAQQIALDTRCYQYDRWTAALKQAADKYADSYKDNADYQAGIKDLLAWDGFSRADSRGALKYYYWQRNLRLLAGAAFRRIDSALTDYMAALSRPAVSTSTLQEEDFRLMAASVAVAMKGMRDDFGGMDRAYGDLFRVGRDKRSWPVGGGSLNEAGMATVRAIVFGSQQPDKTRWGNAGQTSTQVVVLTKPVRSWTQPPIGQSDRPDSSHYADQAEKLFSATKMKSTWYSKEDLLLHVESRKELSYR